MYTPLADSCGSRNPFLEPKENAEHVHSLYNITASSAPFHVTSLNLIKSCTYFLFSLLIIC